MSERRRPVQTTPQLRFVSLWIALTLLLAAILAFALFYQAASV